MRLQSLSIRQAYCQHGQMSKYTVSFTFVCEGRQTVGNQTSVGRGVRDKHSVTQTAAERVQCVQ